MKPKLILGLALILSGATLFAADSKDFSKEQIDKLWPELWKMGATEVKVPAIDPLSEQQVVEEMAGEWNAMFALGKLVIFIGTNRQASISGIKFGKAWEKHGAWKVISDKLVLFMPENEIPDFIFYVKGKPYIFNPDFDTLVSEMKRPKLPATLSGTGAQQRPPIRPVNGKICKAQVLDILDSIDKAAASQDAAAVVANFASNAVVTTTTVEGQRNDTTKDDTDSYRKKLELGYQGFDNYLNNYKFQRKDVRIKITPDGQKATSQSTLVESYLDNLDAGKETQANTKESDNYEIIDGKILLTKMDLKETIK